MRRFALGAAALYNHSRASGRAKVTVRVRELSGELKAEVMSKEVELTDDLAAFRDDGMSQNPRQHFNLKGVVTYEREKKAVFGVLAGTYAEIEREYGW